VPVTSKISTLAGRVGHGLGFDVTEPPHVSEEDSTVLEPGMTITMEPGVATEYGIFHVEENVIVTESDPEVISVSPRELRTLPA
jgi:Xaa-Pro aminopeptidase